MICALPPCPLPPPGAHPSQVRYVPRSFLTHKQREDVANRLAGQYLVLLLEELRVANHAMSKV